jgi:membrane-associated protease RseP (regulator of RpoE activity)
LNTLFKWDKVNLMNKEDEYIFRYPLGEREAGTRRDSLQEMVRTQMESLLNLLSLYQGGEEVKVDGFRMMNDGESIHPIFPSGTDKAEAQVEVKAKAEDKFKVDDKAKTTDEPKPELQPQPKPQPHLLASFQSLRNAGLYEPRISHIQRVLESLLSVVVLESNGNPVKIDGFRLKDLSHWLVPSAGDPAEIYDHLATRCDCDCSFCYLKGNPPSLALDQPKRRTEEEWEEARTRLKYFSPAGKRALFPALGSSYEFLSHPRALDLLRELREKTDRPFRLSTNGNRLNRDFISELARLQPVYLYLSLNSSSPDRRGNIMGTANPETAIHSLPFLKEQGIPFAVIIVPWPFPSREEMLSDLRQTVAYADRYDAHLLEVSLPGYAGYFSPEPLFDREEVWSSVISEIRALRREVQCPLLIKPSLYEETLQEKKFNLPAAVGVVKNSPAAHGGIQEGDLILSIGGLKVSSRPQARDLLHLHHQNRIPSLSLSVRRGKAFLELNLLTGRHGYPYSPQTDHHLGMIFMGAGVRPSLLEDLKALITNRGARNVLILSSRLVKPVFLQLLQESPLFGGIQIRVEVPENRFFGGNICMGDLLVVQDFIEAIRDYLRKNPPPDLVVIPSSPFSLGQWRRDLEGRVFTEIERSIGLPVVPLDCEPIYD